MGGRQGMLGGLKLGIHRLRGRLGRLGVAVVGIVIGSSGRGDGCGGKEIGDTGHYGRAYRDPPTHTPLVIVHTHTLDYPWLLRIVHRRGPAVARPNAGERRADRNIGVKKRVTRPRFSSRSALADGGLGVADLRVPHGQFRQLQLPCHHRLVPQRGGVKCPASQPRTINSARM